MQDYSSLIRRCKETSLNIFARNTIIDDKLLYSGYFKSINIFSYDDTLESDSAFNFAIDRISYYSDVKYAFYQFPTVANIPDELLIKMLRWITIYDAVFLLNRKNETIVDFGLLSKTFFKRKRAVNFWEDAFIKYIMPFETNSKEVWEKTKYSTKSV